MSHPLAVAVMFLPSRMTAPDTAGSISCPTSPQQQFSQHSRNIRHGQNGKVDTRSRNFALIGERNTWMKWRSTSNLWASSTMSQLLIHLSQTVLQNESTALSSTWYVRCSTAPVLRWNYGQRLSTLHATSGIVFLLIR